MSYHITVDHRSAPQIPALLKQKLKSTLAIWSGINVGSLFPQGRKLGTESVATAFCWSRVGEWQSRVLRHARSPRRLLGVRQLLSPLLWCRLALSTEPEKSERGWGCSTPGNVGEGLPSMLQIMIVLGITKVTVHQNKVGYSGVLHNLCFIDDH